jgi:DNA-binding NarL/FixJ family response regulator
MMMERTYADISGSECPPPDGQRDSQRRITGRHADLLQLMAEGASAKEAGRRLGIAEQTVKNHLQAIYQRLEARNCSHAVALAITAGYVRIDTSRAN